MASQDYYNTSKPLPSIDNTSYAPSSHPYDTNYQHSYPQAASPNTPSNNDIFAPLNHSGFSSPPASRHYDNDPYRTQEDIPLQTKHSAPPQSKYKNSFDPHLERQQSDTILLGPQSDRTKLKKKKNSIWSNIPWVVYILSIIQICVFIAELVKMSNLTGSPIMTKPTFNPMIGPSPYLLISMGARYVPCMRLQDQVQNAKQTQDSVEIAKEIKWPCPNATSTLAACTLSEVCGFEGSSRVPNSSMTVSIDNPWDQPAPNQWFRFITPIFLHGGFIHISGNILLQLLLGRDMEKAIGSVRFFLVYFSSGIFGFVLGGNFAQSGIASTGCSGALFGIIGLVFIDLFYTWPDRKSPLRDLIFLVIMVIIEVVIGLLPTGLDNFSHIGGLLMGLVLGITLLHSPNSLRKHIGEDPVRYHSSKTSTRAKRQSNAALNDDLIYGTDGASATALLKDPVNFFKGRKRLWWVWWLFRAISLLAVVIAFIVLLHNFYNTHSSNCSWCKYMSCIDVKNWCDQGQLTTNRTLSPAPTPLPTSPAMFRL